MRKKVFIFDLGKVLVDFDFSIALARIKEHTSCKDNEIIDFFRNSSVAQGWDKGTVTEEKFYRAAKKTLGLKIEMDRFREIWNEIFTVKKEMVDFTLSLKNTFQIGVLTNTNPWHLHYIREQYTWLGELDTQIASCEVGLLKPDPEIYRLTMRKLNAVPEETLYVDDTEENVLSAQKIGIFSFLFRDISTLKRELISLGLTENDLSDIRNE